MPDVHSAQSAVDSIKHFTQIPVSLEDDDRHTDLGGGPFLSYCTPPGETIHSFNPVDVDDTSEMEFILDQYLRSPSLTPSPSPDDAASESNGAT
jgi:hypothetical protein